jgi:tRNA (Thr-GGU) A37 N-methylase
MSVVRLTKVSGCRLHVENVDIVDGAPLLDIKPYVPMFDVYRVHRIGWLAKAKRKVRKAKADDRFS